MKHFLVISFTLLSISFYGQKNSPKTIRIINDSSGLVKKSDTLAFIPPYIFSGKTKNFNRIDSTFNLYYEDSLDPSESIKNKKEIEEYYRKCCYFWFRYCFDPPQKYSNDSDIFIPIATKYNNHSKTYVPIVSDEDYSAIHLQLKKIENTLNDSIVSSININDDLFQTLSKYSSSLCVLTDIKEYWYVGRIKWAKAKVAACLYRVIVIDMKKRAVFYYNSLISFNNYGPEYISGKPDIKFEKLNIVQYTRLQPMRYILGGLWRVEKKKKQ
ncbi:MAG TPA: hypothetical protein VF411_15260 [Bacteroidia bacterium]